MYGGLSYIGKRFEEANNYFLPNYDPEKPSKFIMYEDYNSLYPSVMASCKMPLGNFKLIKDGNLYLKMLDIIKLPYYEDIQDSGIGKGYILKVDIECPKELFNKFKEYPLCPERKKIYFNDLSDIHLDY